MSAATVCVREARFALMAAANRAFTARDEHDDAALAHWRERADVSREYLRAALEADERDRADYEAFGV